MLLVLVEVQVRLSKLLTLASKGRIALIACRPEDLDFVENVMSVYMYSMVIGTQRQAALLALAVTNRQVFAQDRDEANTDGFLTPNAYDRFYQVHPPSKSRQF
jgi:hypothetical protein